MVAKFRRMSAWVKDRIRSMLAMTDEERSFFNEW